MADRQFYLRAEQKLTDVELNRLFGEHQTNIQERKWIDTSTVLLIFADDESKTRRIQQRRSLTFDRLVASLMEDIIRQIPSSNITIHKSLPLSGGRGRARPMPEPIASTRRGFSTRLNSTTEPKLGFSKRLYSTERASPKQYCYKKRFSDEEVNRGAMKTFLLHLFVFSWLFFSGREKKDSLERTETRSFAVSLRAFVSFNPMIKANRSKNISIRSFPISSTPNPCRFLRICLFFFPAVPSSKSSNKVLVVVLFFV